MQITALTDIVEGKLLNTPSISFVTQIHTNLNKVNEGDAFFVLNHEDIPKAIAKGAFALIFEFETEIIDEEIAWIQVDSLSKAISNVLRYNLLKYNMKYICTNKIFFTLLKLFKAKEIEYIITLKDDLSQNFEMLNEICEEKIIFGTDLKFLKSISAEVDTLEKKNYTIQNLTSHSLFETSFSFEKRFFDKLKLPVLYIEDFLQVMELFGYQVDLKKLNSLHLFKPIFINKSNQVVPFGQTNRFILANTDKDICKLEIAYLQQSYSYANVKIVDTLNSSSENIYSHIKNNHFNALYLCGCDTKTVINILEENYDDARLL